MARDANDWNWDRMLTAQAQMADVQRDIMNCLHKHEVVDVVRSRMVRRLKDAAADLEKLKLSHD